MEKFSLEDAKNEIARKKGSTSWNNFTRLMTFVNVEKYSDEAAKIYAKKKVEEKIEEIILQLKK